MKNSKTIFLALFFAGTSFIGRAQDNDQAMMQQIEHDNQAAIDAIALYPADTRKDILEASRYPEVLVRLNAMQKQSKDQFADMLSPYSREEQEQIWNLTRYPLLITELANDHRKSGPELEEIVSRYPEEIRQTAREQETRNHELLIQIDRSNENYHANMDRLLMNYSRVTDAAFHNLIKQPEVLSTLYDNMQMTVVLGDLYKTDPQYVLFETDSLNQALTAQNAQGAAEWQQSLNENPQAQQEYTQAAEEYAQENGYQPQEYTDDLTPDVTNYNTYAYNWWFGYPTWYTTPCWDPYPFWYDWGFYYGRGHRPVFFGMPSYHFMNWYFYNPEHCRRYPEFGSHCYGYYSSHRNGRYSNPVSRGVNDWRRNNKDVVTKDWDNDRAGRSQRFKEYGQMETERAKYNRSNPTHPMERKDFLEKNRNQYPHTTVVAVAPKTSKGQPYEHPASESHAPEIRPHTKIPDSFYENKSHGTTPANNVTHEQPNRGSGATDGGRGTSTNFPSHVTQPVRGGATENHAQEVHNAPARPINTQTRDANQYHESTWHEAQPQQHYSAPVQHSAPMSAPHSSPPSGGGGGGKRR